MSTEVFKHVEKKLREIISRSAVPEDLPHAENVRKWVLRLRPDASWPLQLAALAHDIERALPDRKVRRSDFSDYDAFKRAHARNSARIVREILDRHPVDEAVKSRITYLIEHHEFGDGGDEEVATLRDADAISFFEVNLPYYFQRNDEEETFFRMRWGYERLSDSARKIVERFRYEEERLNELLARCR